MLNEEFRMSLLLLTALEQAERSGPAVRAAALMHIARVLARSAQAAAEALLEGAISLAKELDGSAASLLLRERRILGRGRVAVWGRKSQV